MKVSGSSLVLPKVFIELPCEYSRIYTVHFVTARLPSRFYYAPEDAESISKINEQDRTRAGMCQSHF